jgi:hypothetical protein
VKTADLILATADLKTLPTFDLQSETHNFRSETSDGQLWRESRFYHASCCVNYTIVANAQGDQIGRIVANWTIVNLGQLFVNNRSSPHSWTIFLQSKSYVAIWTKNGSGYVLGDFLTNSSGHTANAQVFCCTKMIGSVYINQFSCFTYLAVHLSFSCTSSSNLATCTYLVEQLGSTYMCCHHHQLAFVEFVRFKGYSAKLLYVN